MECPFFKDCPFIIKYASKNDQAIKGFVSLYCKGDKQLECKRRAYKNKTGQKPPDNMLPSGILLQEKEDKK
jgi:hypothetical protein